MSMGKTGACRLFCSGNFHAARPRARGDGLVALRIDYATRTRPRGGSPALGALRILSHAMGVLRGVVRVA